MSAEPLSIVIDQHGIAALYLNRPDCCNAFDDALIDSLISALQTIEQDASIKAIVLRGHGKHFSAGADLNWMRRMADASEEENRKDALKLADLMHQLKTSSKPTIAIAHGAVVGGAVGLVCCCDIAIAVEKSFFCLSEVKLGLSPAAISPYVIAAMGQRQARRWMLTAERIDAEHAKAIGLVHEIIHMNDVDTHLSTLLTHVLNNGPAAMARTKVLIDHVANAPHDADLRDYTSRTIAELRASEEGREGLSAFLEKRAPNWKPQESDDV